MKLLFQGHGSYYDYLNERLPVKEFHLKNKTVRKKKKGLSNLNAYKVLCDSKIEAIPILSP